MTKLGSGSRRSKSSGKNIKFEHRLALVNWMLDLFGVACFEDLAKNMRDPAFEGFGEDGVSKFHHCLKLLFDRPELPHDLLMAYDGNIVRYWKAITSKRNADGHVLYPKYFQYLCLLFAEIYLDRYFRDPDRLLSDLNAYVAHFNAVDTLQQHVYGELFASCLPEEAQIAPYAPDDLKKLAFWSATGSGKTLLMHINILQYQHYLKLHGRENQLNRIILLTPNEGLSLQHRDEFQLSGIDADLFDKEAGTLFTGKAVEIIDIHKLKETSGEKTVAIEAFEGRNLVRGSRPLDEDAQPALRERILLRVFGDLRPGHEGQREPGPGARVRQVHPLRLLLQVLLRGRLREGIPHFESGGRVE
jgi:hypothetical protein